MLEPLLDSALDSAFKSLLKFCFFKKFLIPLKSHHVNHLTLMLYQEIFHHIMFNTISNSFTNSGFPLHSLRHTHPHILDKHRVITHCSALSEQKLCLVIGDVMHTYLQLKIDDIARLDIGIRKLHLVFFRRIRPARIEYMKFRHR